MDLIAPVLVLIAACIFGMIYTCLLYTSGDAHGQCDLGRVVIHQHHVGGFNGGVGAQGTHGDAHSGAGQHRGVVDACLLYTSGASMSRKPTRATSSKTSTSQIWYWKEVFELVALVGFLLMPVSYTHLVAAALSLGSVQNERHILEFLVLVEPVSYTHLGARNCATW